MNSSETLKKEIDIVEVRGAQSVVVKEEKEKVDLTKYIEEHMFNFDGAFDESKSNHDLYYSCVQPLVGAVFNKFNAACFAYGQTGSGKTFTMMGNVGSESMNKVPGLYLLAVNDLFALLRQVISQNGV